MGSLDNFLKVYDSELRSFIERNYPQSDLCGKMVNYALSGNGKRVRPALLYLTYRLFSDVDDITLILPSSIALEMVHTYSLIHDDLPCMDDDSKRRSRYTVHVLYGQAQAVLTGDAILTDSFSVISDPSFFGLEDKLEDSIKLKLISYLSQGAGSFGMVKGQVLDVYASCMRVESEPLLKTIQLNKTAKLIQVAMKMGASLGGAFAQDIDEVSQIGSIIGEVFQIQDDLLDASITTKTPGKDSKEFKLTSLTNNSRTDLVRYVNLSMSEVEDRVSKLSRKDKDDEFKKYIDRLISRSY